MICHNTSLSDPCSKNVLSNLMKQIVNKLVVQQSLYVVNIFRAKFSRTGMTFQLNKSFPFFK